MWVGMRGGLQIADIVAYYFKVALDLSSAECEDLLLL